MRTHRATPAVLAIAFLVAGPAANVTSQSTTPLDASPSALPASIPSQGPVDTSSWTPVTSQRYGFTVGHPAGWTERPADHAWTLAADHDWLSSAADRFKGPDLLVSAWSVPVEPGSTADAWLATYCPLLHARCTGLEGSTSAVTMDGHPGTLVRYDADTQAFILVDDQMYVISAWQPESHGSVAQFGGATRLLEGFLSTMHLLPAGTATGVPAPASPSVP